jgi:hypothetical protein
MKMHLKWRAGSLHPESMSIVLWNIHWFHVMIRLPLEAWFNASWFVDQNLIPLLDRFFPDEWDRKQRKLVVHIDNASINNAKVTQNFFEHSPLKRFP